MSRDRLSRLAAASRGAAVPLAALALLAGDLATPTFAQYRSTSSQRCCPPGGGACPPGYSSSGAGSMRSDGFSSSDGSATPTPSPDGTQPQPPDAANQQPNANDQFMNPDAAFNQTASAPSQATASSAGPAGAPGSMGDFFGPTGAKTKFGSGLSIHTTTATSPVSSNMGRQKLVENDTPLPQDRVFANYSFFDDVPLIVGGVNVQRLTLGAEKTFLDGLISLQVRVPFGLTLSSDIDAIAPNDDETELGNVTFTGKLLLAQTDTCALAAGLAVTVPTANDIEIYDVGDIKILEYENEAVHLLPYIGAVFTPSRNCFSIAMLQFDFDANGNSIRARNSMTTQFENVATARDGTYVYASYTMGYWISRRDSQYGIEHGIAPMVEVHYSRSVNDPDDILSATSAMDVVDIQTGRVQALNVVLGMNLQLNRCSNLMLGYVTPVSGATIGEDQFDGEVRAIFNYYFGRPGCHQSCCSR